MKGKKPLRKQEDLIELVPGFFSNRPKTGEIIRDHIKRTEIEECLDSAKVPVTVRLDGILIKQLDEYAKRLCMKRSNLLKIVISSGVYETGLELAKNGLLNDIIENVPEIARKKLQEEMKK